MFGCEQVHFKQQFAMRMAPGCEPGPRMFQARLCFANSRSSSAGVKALPVCHIQCKIVA